MRNGIALLIVAVICSMGCSCDGDKKLKEDEGAKVPRSNIEGLKVHQMQNNDHMFASWDAATVDIDGRLYVYKDAEVSGKPKGSEFIAICKCKEGKLHIISYGIETFKFEESNKGKGRMQAASLLMRPKPPEKVEDLEVLFDSTKPVGNGKK